LRFFIDVFYLDTVLERVYHPTPGLQELASRVSCRLE